MCIRDSCQFAVVGKQNAVSRNVTGKNIEIESKVTTGCSVAGRKIGVLIDPLSVQRPASKVCDVLGDE